MGQRNNGKLESIWTDKHENTAYKICGMELKQNRGKFIAMTLDSTLQNQKKWDKWNPK